MIGQTYRYKSIDDRLNGKKVRVIGAKDFGSGKLYNIEFVEKTGMDIVAYYVQSAALWPLDEKETALTLVDKPADVLYIFKRPGHSDNGRLCKIIDSVKDDDGEYPIVEFLDDNSEAIVELIQLELMED